VGGAIVEPLAGGRLPPLYLIQVVVPMVLVASWLFFTATLTRRWRKQTGKFFADAAMLVDRASPPPAANSRIPNRRILARFTLRGLSSLGAALAVAFFGFVLGIYGIPRQRGMHVSPREAGIALPDGASDVCFLRGPRSTITFDFAIDEAGFRHWVESDLDLSELKAADPPIKPVVESLRIFSCSDDPDEQIVGHLVNHGWYYSWREGFHSRDKAYDSDTGRAYFDSGF
ncbi:MAG TPA: hypothetical protein VGG30_03980, partial [Pirellulales bacterium]